MGLVKKVIRSYLHKEVASLLPSERPLSLTEAETYQDQIIQELGLSAAAWKLGASNIASHNALGFERPFSGLLSNEHVIASGSKVKASEWRQKGVECELAVRFKSRVEPIDASPYRREDVQQALEFIYPTLEIPHTRFKTLVTTEGPFALVADNGASGYAVIGETTGMTLEDITPLCSVTLRVDGVMVTEGSIDSLIMDPLALVTDHVNRLMLRGYTIEAGEYVLLGSLSPYQPLDAPAHIAADFGKFGSVSVHYI